MNTLTISSNRRPGFSLIEVLIAVMILSLGLLGLAAVFPVIIRQQRLSGDATQGLIVAKSAEAYIRSHTLLNKPSLSSFGVPLPQDRRGWDLWRYEGINNNNVILDAGEIPDVNVYRDVVIGSARLPQLWDTRNSTSGGLRGIVIDRSLDIRGDCFPFGSNFLTNPARQFEEPVIPLRDRLWPAPYSAVDENWQESKYANEPRFVWDMAMMRDEAGTPAVFNDDRVRIAVFVRRIDSAMRLPVREVADDIYDPLSLNGSSTRPSPANGQFRNVRLSDVLICTTGTANEDNRTKLATNADYRVPVAVDAAGAAGDGLPTQDGNGNYAGLLNVFVDRFEDPENATNPQNFTRLIFSNSGGLLNSARRVMLRQPNQRFADNLGNVYTVVKVDDTNPDAVIITPPAPLSARQFALLGPNALQLVYSPTPPAAINIFTVEPK